MILASVVNTLLRCYTNDERTKSHLILLKRVGVNIRKEIKKYGSESVKTILEDGDYIWKKTVDKFADEKIAIEASACILSVVGKDEKNLCKTYGLCKGILGKWAKPSKADNAYELEKNARLVADFVYEVTSEKYEIEVEKKETFGERLKRIRNEKME